MRTLRIIYDGEDRTSQRVASALRKHAPPDFEVSVAPLHQPKRAAIALGDAPADAMFLLAPKYLRVVTEAMQQREWQSKVVAAWSARVPCEIDRFFELYNEADAWVIDDQEYWETLGRLPRTFLIPCIHAQHGREQSAEIFRLFRNLLECRRQRRTRRRNLTKAVTVFVTTVGAPTFSTCLERLREQDCTFRLQIIDHVAPMNVAFQHMVDECRTPYYVQVDEDMLLYPGAVGALHEAIADAAPNVAMCVADLYDVHLARSILGVKIFRHHIVRRYPLEATDSFEAVQLNRMVADGYTYLHITKGPSAPAGRNLGLHGVQWTLQSIYERYATLARRRGIYPSQLGWLHEYPLRFLQRFLDAPSAENFFALQGMIAGTLASRQGEARAKDYRTYAALPGFQSLLRVLEELGQPLADARIDRERRTIARSPVDPVEMRKRRPSGPQRPRVMKGNGDWRGYKRDSV